VATDKSRRFRDFSCPSRAYHAEIPPFERVVVRYGARVTTPLRSLVLVHWTNPIVEAEKPDPMLD